MSLINTCLSGPRYARQHGHKGSLVDLGLSRKSLCWYFRFGGGRVQTGRMREKDRAKNQGDGDQAESNKGKPGGLRRHR